MSTTTTNESKPSFASASNLKEQKPQVQELAGIGRVRLLGPDAQA